MVSFDLSDDQRMISETVKKFALNEMRAIYRDCDEKGTIPPEFVSKAWELFLIPNNIPEAYGGVGEPRSVVTSTIIAEELAYGDFSLAVCALAPATVVYPLIEFGTEEQKQKYLPMFCEEQFKAAAAALMEPRIDFDLPSMKTTAALKGSEYVINGEKCLVPLAADAQVILVYAQTDASAGAKGVQAFLVDKGTAGMELGEREKNMGIKALDTRKVTFKDCRVPKANRLGGDAGCDTAKLINYTYIGLAAMATGVSKAAFEYARDYAKEREAFGEPIASRQAIAFMLAEMAIEVDATRLLAWEAAWRLDKGLDCDREAYLAKQYAAEKVLMITDRAVQILGGHGYIREHPVELWLRNGRGFATFEGLVTA
ncbi:MAG: acyl-CoA dehydrogenase [Candidatus Abyssobacteria bacterium SURF_17]|uniref:Acyl-CoA dehydrogenase n=1 Tax=Candidatus Abyssobacteria bacterium SURF_17 TaxID=2093361 RepID=A0A419EP22_9BACT|nr:MAG: acyl-CoA dehydrogenase [Candidatus Abyssubacteria bacterium SURF_17]